MKSRKSPVFVIPVNLVLDLIGERESRGIKHLWTPAFAGVTALETFYMGINNSLDLFRKAFIIKSISVV